MSYTAQQIEECCKDLERCIKLIHANAETSHLPQALQIIKQLQAELAVEQKKNRYYLRCLGDLLSLLSGENWRIVDAILKHAWKGTCPSEKPIILPEGE